MCKSDITYCRLNWIGIIVMLKWNTVTLILVKISLDGMSCNAAKLSLSGAVAINNHHLPCLLLSR